MQQTTRRRALAALGTGAAALAGCLGGGGDTPADRVESLPRPTAGDADAPVTVAAFTDFACPHCRTWNEETWPPLAGEYVDGGVVRYEHYDFPIPVHQRWSWGAAGVARAVQDRADDAAFFAVADRIYDLQGSFSEDALVEAVDAAADVDAEAAVADGTAGVYRPVVDADRGRGRDRGVDSTPTVFVDGRAVEPTRSAVESAIELARE
jgi:protein-disulfide isomerase